MANVSSDDMTHVLFTASFLHAFSHIFFSVCGALYFFARSQVMLTHCLSLEFVRMLFPTTCTTCHKNSIIFKGFSLRCFHQILISSAPRAQKEQNIRASSWSQLSAWSSSNSPASSSSSPASSSRSS